jgi:hypothetical protein
MRGGGLPMSLRSRRRDIVGGEQGTEFFFKKYGLSLAMSLRCKIKKRHCEF